MKNTQNQTQVSSQRPNETDLGYSRRIAETTHTHTHTPGPWSASINSKPLYTSAEIYGPPNGFGMVASIHASVGSDGEKLANARLIAAAPELLDALKEALANLEYLGLRDNKLPGMMQRINCAIAKAEGVK
jgi:hypothetical protein